MKGYGIEIKNTLLEPKHVEAMGSAVWLYMWLIDHITSVREDGLGVVLGEKPIKFEEISSDLGMSADTYTRWIDRLVKYPYIKITRTPYGTVYHVFKAHKRFRKNAERFRKTSEVGSAEMRNVIKTVPTEPVDNNKDNNPKGLQQAGRSFGDPEINSLIGYLESKLGGSADGGKRQNRNFAFLLVKRFRKDYPDKDPVILGKWLISAALSDSFHAKNATNFGYLYHNTQKIVQSAKSRVIDSKVIAI